MSTNEEEGFSTIVFNAVMCFFLGGLTLMWGLDVSILPWDMLIPLAILIVAD